jgi:hypothetical protein
MIIIDRVKFPATTVFFRYPYLFFKRPCGGTLERCTPSGSAGFSSSEKYFLWFSYARCYCCIDCVLQHRSLRFRYLKAGLFCVFRLFPRILTRTCMRYSCFCGIRRFLLRAVSLLSIDSERLFRVCASTPHERGECTRQSCSRAFFPCVCFPFSFTAVHKLLDASDIDGIICIVYGVDLSCCVHKIFSAVGSVEA